MDLQEKIAELCNSASEEVRRLCDNHDLIKVSKSVVKRFNILTSEEKENCILLAVWKCVKKYDPDKNPRLTFTTYLYRGVEIECLTLIKYNKRGYCSQALDSRISYKSTHQERVDLIDQIKEDDNYEILYDRFFLDVPIDDIAISHGCSYELIRQKIKQSLARMRGKLSECV